jgi:hypothetical protein
MTCRVNLFNRENNKVLKTEFITKDTYFKCEEEIQKRNKKLKYPKFWKITTINV